MMRIAILGNSGSGKSYLAGRLGQRHQLPVLDLDDVFWKPAGQYVTKRPAEEVLTIVETKRREPLWIVEGVYGELIEPFLTHADLLVWIDVPWQVCRHRLESRRRPTDLVLDPAAFDKLLTYAAAYWQRDDGRSCAGHRRLFEAFSRQKAHLTSEPAVEAFMARTNQRAGGA